MKSDPTRAFTLVELLIVMAVIGIVSSTALLRTNFAGGGDDQEFRQVLTFLRRQHARTLRSSKALTVRFERTRNQILAVDENDDVIDRLSVNRWRTDNRDRITISPWSAQADRLTFVNESGTERQIVRDWIMGFEPGNEAN